MKTKLIHLSIALFVIFGAQKVSAQETKDYFKFDDNGYLCEFLRTLPDSVLIQYRYYGNDDKNGLILYPDGTQIDYTESIKKSFDGPYISHSVLWSIPAKDWYKELRQATSAPKISEMIDGCFGLGGVTIIFKDNSQVTISYSSNDTSNYIKEYVDVCENGDMLSINYWGNEIKLINLQDPRIIDNSTGALKSVGHLVSGGLNRDRIEGNDFYNCKAVNCKGRVITSEGDTYTGSFRVLLEGEQRSYMPKSPYLRAFFKDKIDKEDNRLPFYGIDNITAILFGDGNVVNKDNTIVAMYRDSEQLDELDMASVLAAEQGRIDRMKADAEKAASEKTAITNKYGKKYADAFFAGKAIVGMPWSLVEIGLNAHSFKNFYTALLSFERQSGNGKKKCYSLIGDNFAYVGNMWVANGAIESITYY